MWASVRLISKELVRWRQNGLLVVLAPVASICNSCVDHELPNMRG